MTWLSILILIIISFLFWLLLFRKGLASALSAFSKKKLSRFESGILWGCSFLIFFLLWDILSKLIPQGMDKIPGPIQTIESAWRLLLSGELVEEAIISCIRILVGFIAASAAGVSIGLLAGSFLLAKRLIQPVNSFIRYIPPTAFISLLIVYFGIGETYKYAVVFFGLVFFITQMVIDVVDDVDLRHVELAQTSGFRNWDIFWRVIVPYSGPRILDVLRINLGAAWTFLVAAELIGAERGLGHFVAVSQRFLRLPDLYVGILTFGLIGLASDQLLGLLGRLVFRWQQVELRRGN